MTKTKLTELVDVNDPTIVHLAQQWAPGKKNPLADLLENIRQGNWISSLFMALVIASIAVIVAAHSALGNWLLGVWCTIVLVITSKTYDSIPRRNNVKSFLEALNLYERLGNVDLSQLPPVDLKWAQQKVKEAIQTEGAKIAYLQSLGHLDREAAAQKNELLKEVGLLRGLCDNMPPDNKWVFPPTK